MNPNSGSHHLLHGFSPLATQQPSFSNLISPSPPPPRVAEHLPLRSSNFSSNNAAFSYPNPPHFPSLDNNIVSSFLAATAAPATPKPKPRKRPRPDGSTPTATPAEGGSIVAAVTQPCTECGKRFASQKALFGHMRCHPERQWRGINPPPNFRRGALLLPTPATFPAAAAAVAFFTDEEYDVAASLLMLSCGPPRSQFILGAAAAPRSGRKELGKKKRAWGGDRADAFGGGGEIHRCDLCDKGFSSGQALGGHKGCHWEEGGEGAMGGCLASHKDYALDLNMPPPQETMVIAEGSNAAGGHALDLKLGF